VAWNLQKRLLSDSEANDSENKDVKKKDGMVFDLVMTMGLICCINFEVDSSVLT